MGIEDAKNGKLLYHLTKLSNMESIVSKGLLPRRYLINTCTKFSDIADEEIIHKRKFKELDKYVPFHFHPYSSFDVAVKNKYPNEEFAYICIKRDLAIYGHFKILLNHPLSKDGFTLYDYDEGIEKIDWDAMKPGKSDSYSRNVKMSECITDKGIPATLFQCVYVSNSESKRIVEDIFARNGITEQPPFVNIQKIWFERMIV